MGAKFIKKLPIPLDVKSEYPVSDKLASIKLKKDKEIADIISGKSDKFLLIVGPCSADNNNAVLDYVGKLKIISDDVKDKIVIVPRVYTNKPRTLGDGYMGMLHQPDPNEKPDILKGIIGIRNLYIKILSDYNFVCADELLYPDNFRYWSDILGYVTIGARSVENQQHRLTASGIDIPVGLKNPTNGNLNIMMNAICSANKPHTFIYRGWQVESTGNPLSHGILRGAVTKNGEFSPNYSYDNLKETFTLYSEFSLPNKAVIVDTNHANSSKNPFFQPTIAVDVINSRNKDNDIKSFVKGLMVESYLQDGAQEIGDNIYGKSITDACLGFEKTKEMIYKIAEIL